MRHVIALAVLGAATTAQADLFQPPKGCTVYLTQQLRSCIVKHHWTCENDAPGEKWHGELSEKGLVRMGQVDHEAQWLENYYLTNDTHELLIPPAEDPQSLTNLIETGTDTYDFRLDSTRGVHRVRGRDSIIERGVIIDGEPLLRTEYEIEITDAEGNVTYAATGSEFVSETHRSFLGGYGRVSAPGQPFEYNHRPVEFIYPDEPGFLDTRPKYGCDVIKAHYEPRQSEGEQP